MSNLKEEASRLVDTFNVKAFDYRRAIEYALICVDEIIDVLKWYDDDLEHWQELKKEIEKL